MTTAWYQQLTLELGLIQGLVLLWIGTILVLTAWSLLQWLTSRKD